MSDTVLKPDLCILGAGAAGLALAETAAGLGRSVALVEKAAMGGDRFDSAGAASMALRAAAGQALNMTALRNDLGRLFAHLDRQDSALRYAAMGVRVIRAAGRFVSARSLEAGGLRIDARRFVVATGASPSQSRIPGLETVRPLTARSVFDLPAAPKRLIVVGGSVGAVEIAQLWRRVGVETVLLAPGEALPGEDAELAAAIMAAVQADGVVLKENATIGAVEPMEGGVRVRIDDGGGTAESIDGSHILLAHGHAPNVDGLGLEAAGVAFDRGGIITRADLRTGNARIFAIGAVRGGARSTHAARNDADTMLRNMLSPWPVRTDPTLAPRVLGTDPALAVVGMDEAQARAHYREIRVLRWPVAENDRARAEGKTRGHIRVVASRGGRIVGAAIVASDASEWVAFWQLAIARRATIRAVALLPLPYDSIGAASRSVARAGLARQLREGWRARAMRAFGMG